MVTDIQKQLLEKDTIIIEKSIRALYRKLDARFHLCGGELPITFGYETDLLGSYVRQSREEAGHFHFSLLFTGYSVQHPLSKEDRTDLYLHEYAHYMQYNMPIPDQYKWQSGVHGSAWKYCCSLIGAAPTPYYKAGEALMKHDYDKVLTRKNIASKAIPVTDIYHREQQYKAQKNREIKYSVGDEITHPKFGTGLIQKIEPLQNSVMLHVRFGQEERKIDQAWLLKVSKVSGRRVP